MLPLLYYTNLNINSVRVYSESKTSWQLADTAAACSISIICSKEVSNFHCLRGLL